MKDLVLKAINQFSLFKKGDTVTVALSGGADSVALLYCLYKLKDELGIELNAAHLNHTIRGEEADRDQKFVEQFCESLSVPLFCEKSDVPKYAADNHLSLELAAREVRYDFLSRVACGKIATAHTASDNLETLIFNLTRGTALKGLCGIPPKRDNIVRPVIFCTREDIENFCENNGLAFVTDSTNLSDDYSRNKIRHNIIPVLKEINRSVENSAVKTAVSLSEDNTFLERKAHEYIFTYENDGCLSLLNIESLDISIAKRVIIDLFNICYPNISLENSHISEIYNACLSGKAKVNLPSGLYGVVENGMLKFTDGLINQKQFTVNLSETENVNNLFSNNAIDYDMIVGKLEVRTRQEGDKIRLFGSRYTKTLKKLFTEFKIPLDERENLPVLSDQNGVVWVHKIGVSSRCAVTDSTKRIIKIEALSGGINNE